MFVSFGVVFFTGTITDNEKAATSAEVAPGIAMVAAPDGGDEEKEKPAQSMGKLEKKD